LLHGEVARAFTLHAFAPALVGALALLLAAALLGSRPRRTLVNAVRRVEERTGITLWLLGAIIVYWALRFSLDGQRVFQLVP
jgi:cation transporter-like permease